MLKLSDSLLVAKGGNRACYKHPADPSKCVKLDFHSPEDHSGRKRRYYRIHSTKTEVRYYKRFQRKGISWEMLPRYFGELHTDKGTGYVFSLIRDYDGNVSKTLEYYLESEAGSIDYPKLYDAFVLLKQYLQEQGVVVYSMFEFNVLYQKVSPDTIQLVLVDGVGNNQLFPVANYFSRFAKRLIARKWQKFESRLLAKYGGNALLCEILGKIPGPPV